MGTRHYDELLDIHALASLINKSVNTIYDYRSRGTGPRTWKFHGRIVAWKSDALEWLAAQETSSARGGVR